MAFAGLELPSLEGMGNVGLMRPSVHGSGGAAEKGNPFEEYIADLVRVPIDYVFEIVVGGKIEAAVTLPITPQMIRVTRPSATVITHTFGTLPIREHTYNKMLNIEIRGISGHTKRQGYTPDGKMAFKEGFDHVKNFDIFLDRYQTRATERNGEAYLSSENFRDLNNHCYLVFRAFKENIHVLVEPTEWEIIRDAKQDRVGCSFRLAMTAYRAADMVEPQGLFGPYAKYVSYITQCVDLGSNVVATANNFMRSVNLGIDVLRGPGRALVSLGAQTRHMMQGVGAIHSNVRGLVTDYAVALQQFSSACNEAVSLSEQASATWGKGGAIEEAFKRIVWNAERAAIAGREAMGAAGVGAADQQAVRDATTPQSSTNDANRHVPFQSPSHGPGPDVALRTVNRGEDLFIISKWYYGKKKSWPKIANYNKMIDAYTKEDGSPLLPGDVLYIPDVPQQTQPFISKTDDPMDMFGVDLLLDEKTGDLVVKEGRLDVATVQGPSLLSQALRNRFSTPRGHSRSFPDYGIPVSPGQSINPNMLGYVGAHIQEQVLRDLRFKGIRRIGVVDGGDILLIGVEAVPQLGESVFSTAPLLEATA